MEACTLISELCDAKCNEGTMKQKLKNFWYFVDFRNVPEVGPENCLQKLAVYSFFFFLVRSAMRQPFRAVMQHLGGSWDKRHAMRFYVLHVALGLRSASYVQGTYEDVTNMPPIPN